MWFEIIIIVVVSRDMAEATKDEEKQDKLKWGKRYLFTDNFRDA